MNCLTRQKTLIILLLLSCCSGAAFAQTLMWAKNMGGTGNDFGRATDFDTAGNIYTVGDFRGTADFDPGLGAADTAYRTAVVSTPGGTNTDIFVSKLDKNGNYLWAHGIGGTGQDASGGIAAAPNGDVYVTGTFAVSDFGSIDFDPGTQSFPMTSNGLSDIFICKFKANGDFAWAVKIGGTGNESGPRIVLDDQENIYVTGFFTGVVDFDPGTGTSNLGSGTTVSGFVLKLNKDGVYQWASNIGAGGRGIALDQAGNILVTGSFSATVDFNPDPSLVNNLTASSTDVFVLKLNNAGGYVWAVKLGGTGADAGTAIAVGNNNNVYTVGTFNATADFDPGPLTENLASSGSTDIFISVLDASGSYVWAKKVGGTGADLPNSVAVDGDNRVYIGGRYEGTVDFDPGPGTKVFTSLACCGGTWIMPDAFMLKLDNNGDFEWAFSFGGEDGTENVNTINIDRESNLYITGNITGYANFALPPDTFMVYTQGTGDDAYVAKYAQPSCKSYKTLQLTTGCPTLTVNGETYTANGTYEQVLKNANAMGCDSILTLQVFLNNSLPTTINQTACNSFTFNGKTYTSSTTFRDTFQNVNNCDSVVVHHLTINKGASTLISRTACNSYTYNGTTYTSSGTYPHFFQTTLNCDSVVMLNLTINNPSTPTTTPVTACGSYTFGGTTYTTGGTYTHTFTNRGGCDSTATINLTINQPTSSQINVTACGSYTYDGVTYTANGAYTHYFTNSVNCDSVVVLFLTLTQGSTSQLSATACNQYTLNGETYTASGTYTQTMTAANGCDSVITLNLTINQTPEATITSIDDLFVGGGGSSYQWLDCNNNYAPIPSATSQTLVTDGAGRYAVEVTFRGCKDTSDCLESFPAGIDKLEGDKITIYPNPAGAQVVIASTAAFTDASVTLINVNGQRMLNKKNQRGDKITLNLNGLATGVYIVEVAEGEKIYRSTLLKE